MSRPNSIKGTERSKPVGIARSPNRNEEDRPQDEETAASRNPLTAYFSPGGLTPPPNIPPRIGSFSSRQGAFGNTGLSSSPYTGAGVLRPGLPATTNSGASTPIPGATGGGTDAAMAAALSDAPTGAGTPGSQGDRRASGAGTPVPTDLDHLTEEEKLRVLRKHLVSREERLGEGSQSRRPSTTAELQAGGRPRVANVVHFPSDDNQIAIEVPADTSGASIADEEDDFPIHYTAPGADITHSIYKYQSNARREYKRARSTSEVARQSAPADPRFQHIHEPGGFRRNYLALKADEQGEEQPPMLNNFIEFLYLFGHFGGEDLEEDEEEQDDDQTLGPEGISSRSEASGSAAEAGLRVLRSQRGPVDFSKPLERTPLLSRTTTSRSLSRRRKGSISEGAGGTATVTQAILMLLKSFIGTGILFLGKAFFNGGMLFSTLILAFIALISLYSFVLLVKTKFVVSGSFGDLGGTLYGPWMRFAILLSIIISQLGFVSAYTIFIAENFQALVLAASNCKHHVPIGYLIAIQGVILVPLSLVRNLAKLSTTALVADAFILVGLVYIGSNEVAVIAKRGVADVMMFNPKNFPLLIGTAVFSFEGIGLVIPITDAMKEPHKFPAVLSGVMIFLMFLFGGAGILSYAAYGSDVQTVILVNLPSEKKFVQVVQFLYASAILLSTPLQLFPAIRIMENALFGSSGISATNHRGANGAATSTVRVRSGKTSKMIKWEKNLFRFSTVVVCYLVAYAGAKDLDKFVSFIGSFACIPLCYVYPAMLHYRACSRTRWDKTKDIALMVFGTAAAVFTTVQTIKLMIEPSGPGGPDLGTCSPAAPGDKSPLGMMSEYLLSLWT